MQTSIVSDELSGDPATAIELGLEWGVRHFELRGIHAERVPRLAAHARHALLQLVRSSGITVTALSPGLFKIPFPQPGPARSNLGWMASRFHDDWAVTKALLDDHLTSLLPQSIELAHALGTDRIIVFSFERSAGATGEAPDGVVETLQAAAETARAGGVRLLVENEEGHWANTGAATARLLDRVASPHLGVNWDPANARIDGDTPFPDGYGAVRDRIANVHFKDVVTRPDGSWAIAAEGEVDWKGQIGALIADGYQGAIAVEPHLSPSVASTRRALERLRGLIDAAQAG